MVYKKYVKKNGKTFGPYYYESYRENGVVKKRYIGQEKPGGKSDGLKKVVPHIFLVALALLVAFGLLYHGFTGNVVSVGNSTNGNSTSGNLTSGNNSVGMNSTIVNSTIGNSSVPGDSENETIENGTVGNSTGSGSATAGNETIPAGNSSETSGNGSSGESSGNTTVGGNSTIGNPQNSTLVNSTNENSTSGNFGFGTLGEGGDVLLTECGNLTTSGAYVLQNDIISDGTCFNIKANNVTLDGSGFQIKGNNTGKGIYSNETLNLTIKNITITGFKNGIYFEGVNGSLIKNVNSSANGNNGIYLDSSFKNIIQNVTTNDNAANNGIYLDSSSNNKVQNVVSNNNYVGISLDANSNFNAIKNTTTKGETYGIYLDTSSNNTFQNSLSNNNNKGITLASSSQNNSIKNARLINNSIGVEFYCSSSSCSPKKNLFEDIKINESGTNDVYSYFGSNNTFVNASYSSEQVTSGNLYRGWYYQAYVNDTSGNALNNVTINAINSGQGVSKIFKTNSLGYSSLDAYLISYVNNGTRNYYGNYILDVSKTGYSRERHSYNVTSHENYLDSFTLTKTTLESCANLTESNTIYTLTQDIFASESCFYIKADNITLNGNRFNVTGDLSGKGIVANGRLNLTIMDLTLSNFSNGLDFEGVSGSLIKDVGSNSNSKIGFYLYNSYNNTISNSSAVSNSQEGINLESSTSNLLSGNNLDFNNYSVLLYSSSNYNELVNNTANSNNYGIYIKGSNNNSISGGFMNGSTSNAIYLPSGNYNVFDGLTIKNTGALGYDIHIYSNALENKFMDMSSIGKYNLNGASEILVENSEYGLVKLIGSMSTTGLNFSRDVKIGNNSAAIRSDVNPDLNIPANITLYGIGDRKLVNPAVLKDGVACGADCRNFTSLTAQTVKFNVTSGGTYTIGEEFVGPVISCQNLTRANTVYTLYYNLSTSGTCFNIQADNITFNGNGHSITGDDSGNGVYASGRFNVTVENLKINDFENGVNFGGTTNSLVKNIDVNSSTHYGIYFGSSSNNNLISGGLINDSNEYGIYLDSGNYNTLKNITVENTNPSYQDVFVSSGVSNTHFLNINSVGSYRLYYTNGVSVENSIYGKIKFLNEFYTFEGNNFSKDFVFGNNSIEVRSDLESGLNVPANVTLYGVGDRGFAHPMILKDGDDCGLDCNNFTSLTAENVKFSVAGFSNYSIGDNLGSVANCQDLTIPGTIYTLRNNISTSGTCFTIKADNVTLDGNGYSITGNGNYNGVYAENKSNLTIFDLTINQFNDGVNFQNVTDSLIKNISYNSNNDNYGIGLSSSSNNKLVNNEIITNNKGISLSSSSNNQLINNIISPRHKYAIYFSSSNNNIVSKGLIYNSGNDAIYIDSGNNNSFNNVRIQGTGSSYQDVYLGSGVSGTRFVDMSSIGKYDFNSNNYVSVENTKYGKIKFLSPLDLTGSNFTRDIWFGNNSVKVRADLKPNLNKPANVTLYGSPGANLENPEILKNSFNCNSHGEMNCYNFTSLEANRVKFNVTGWSNYSIGESNPAAANEIINCQNLTQANTVYELENNVSATGNCFVITANNITLDGNGYSVISNGNGNGIYSSERTGLTIENLTVNNFNYGLNFDSVNNSLIKGINFVSSDVDGIYLQDYSNNNTVVNNIVNSNIYGIYVGPHSNNNTIKNNLANSNWYNGLTIDNSDYNNVINNTVNSNNQDNSIYYGGIIISASSYNNIINNTANLNIQAGIDIKGSSNNNEVLNNLINSSLEYGLYIDSSSNNNLISGGLINNSKRDAIYLVSGNNNEFKSVEIQNTSSSYYDVYLGNEVSGTKFRDMDSINKYDFNSNNYVTVENTKYGKLKFLESLTLTGSNFTRDIWFGNDSVTVRDDLELALDVPANVTLYGIGDRNFTDPSILKDGKTCFFGCSNFTSLEAENVKFNVTSWSNYSIGEHTAFNSSLTTCGLLLEPNMVYNLQNDINTTNTCFIFKADNITLNGNGYVVRGNKVGSGVLSVGRYNSSVVNLTLDNFYTGLNFTTVNDSSLENIRSLSNNYGIYLNGGKNFTLNYVNSSHNSNSGFYIYSSFDSLNVNNSVFNHNSQYGFYARTTLTNFNAENDSFNNNNNGMYFDYRIYSAKLGNLDFNNNGVYGFYSDDSVYNSLLRNLTANYNSLSTPGSYYHYTHQGFYFSKGLSNTTINGLVSKHNYGGGIYLGGGSNSVVKNLDLETNYVTNYGAEYGLYLYESHNYILENIYTKNNSLIYSEDYGPGSLGEGYGIELNDAQNTTLINSNITDEFTGLYITSNGNNNGVYRPNFLTMKNNSMSGSYYNFHIDGTALDDYKNNIDSSNKVDGKRIYYNYSISNYVFNSSTAPDAGIVICANCSNIKIEDVNLSAHGYNEILLSDGNNFVINNVTSAYGYNGLNLQNSQYGNITNSVFYNNDNDGIYLKSNVSFDRFENLELINNSYNGLEIDPATYQTPKSFGDNMVFNNITVKKNSYEGYYWDIGGGVAYGGLNLNNLNDSILSNISSSGNYYYGVSLQNAENVTLANILSLNDNNYAGVYVSGITESDFNNVTSNSGGGISLGCDEMGDVGVMINNTFTNITANSNSGTGITIGCGYYGSTGELNNNKFIHIISNGNSRTGISINGLTNSTFYDVNTSNNYCSSYCSGSSGLSIDSSFGVNFTNLVSNGNDYGGIYIANNYGSYPGGLTFSNLITKNNEYGYYTDTSNDASINITIHNMISNNNQYGLWLYNFHHNITNLTINNNSHAGIYIYNSNNVFSNISADSNYYGIEFVSNTNNNSFIGGTINNSKKYGIYFSGSSTEDYNKFVDMNIINTNSSYYDLYSDSSGQRKGNKFIDSYLGSYNFNGNNNWINTTVENSNYGSIILLDNISGSGTDFSGNVQINNNLAFVNDSNTDFNSSLYISLYGIGSWNFTTPTILRNGEICGSDCQNFTALDADTVKFRTASAGNYTIGEPTLTDCRALNISNAVYYLTKNVSTSTGGSCFVIGADNITLNGDGHSVIGSGVGEGIKSEGKFGTKIVNLTIENFKDGIIFTSVMGALVKEVDSESNGFTGITISNSNGSVVLDNNLESNGDNGIYLSSSENSRIINNTGSFNYGGIYLSSSNNNTISGNTLSNSNKDGIHFSSSENNTVEGNSVKFAIGEGISLESSENNRFSSNTINLNKYNGVQFYLSSGNVLSNNTLRDNGYEGVYLNSSEGNQINNNIIDLNDKGVEIYNSTSNLISGGLINSSSKDSIYLDSGDNNTIDSVEIQNTGSGYYDIHLESGISETKIIDMFSVDYNLNSDNYITVENSEYGKVKFLSNLTTTGDNLSSIILFNDDLIDVRTDLNSEFDVPANVTLFGYPGAGFTFPGILRDGVACGASCRNFTSLKAENVKFNVTGFTNYSIGGVDSPPLVSFTQPTDSGTVGRNYIVVNATAEDIDFENLTIFLYKGSTLVDKVNSTQEDLYHEFTGLSNGNYLINATAFDSSGGSNSTVRNVDVSVSSPPGGGGGGGGPENPPTENPVCGNGVVETGEQCDLGSQNGVEGSGCSSSCEIVEPENQTCVPDYNSCGSWGSCLGGTQFRTCSDTVCGQPDQLQQRSCSCTPDITCTSWSLCKDGVSTRSCSDQNKCSGSVNQVETRNCAVNINTNSPVECNPDVSCGNWSLCQYNTRSDDVLNGSIDLYGTQTRYCEDSNGCLGNYVDTRECSSKIDVRIREKNVCGVKTLSAVNAKTGEPVALVNIDAWADKKLDIEFVSNNATVCSSCFDGIQDGNETGIDCGGICGLCRPVSYSPEPSFFVSNGWFNWWLFGICLLLALIIIIVLYKRRMFRKHLESSKSVSLEDERYSEKGDSRIHPLKDVTDRLFKE